MGASTYICVGGEFNCDLEAGIWLQSTRCWLKRSHTQSSLCSLQLRLIYKNILLFKLLLR